MMQQPIRVRILPLGLVIRPNMLEGVLALAAATGLSAQQVGRILQDPQVAERIFWFKMGRYPVIGRSGEEKLEDASPVTLCEQEEAFVMDFVERINSEMPESLLTPAAFRACWSAMNPKSDQYAALWQDLRRFHQATGNYLCLITFSNRLDFTEMQKNGIDVNPDSPESMDGIPVDVSYHLGLSESEMLKRRIGKLLYPRDKSVYEQPLRPQPSDIAWVHAPVEDPAAAKREAEKRFGTDPAVMLEVCQAKGIETLVWQPGTSLYETLCQVPVSLRPALSPVHTSE